MKREEFTEKLFKAGLFGIKYGELSDEEKIFVKIAPHIEIVDDVVISALRKKFTKNVNKNTDNISDKSTVRMNTAFWLFKACGRILFTKQECFLVLNYFVTNQEKKIKMLDLGHKLNIGTKETSYVVNLYKKHGVLAVDNDGLIFYCYNIKEKVIGTGIFENSEVKSVLPSLVTNYTIDEIVENEINARLEGVTTDLLAEKYGIHKRNGLQVIEYVVKINTEKYVISEQFKGSSCLKVAFKKENKKKFDDAKKQKIKGSTNDLSIEYVTRDEKVALMKEYFDNFTEPILYTRDFLDELRVRLNMKESFDKMAMLKIAREVGFKDTRVFNQKSIRILYTDKYTEEEIHKMYNPEDVKKPKGPTRLEKMILFKPEFLIADNFYEDNENIRMMRFYTMLKNNQSNAFSGESILNMSLKTFLRNIKVDKMHFLPTVLKDISHKNFDERLMPSIVDLEKEQEYETYKKLIKNLGGDFTIFKDFSMVEYRDFKSEIDLLLKCKLKYVLHAKTLAENRAACVALSPMYYEKMFVYLKKLNFINFEIKECVFYYSFTEKTYDEEKVASDETMSYENRLVYVKYLNNCNVNKIEESTKAFLNELEKHYASGHPEIKKWIERFVVLYVQKKKEEKVVEKQETDSSFDFTDTEEENVEFSKEEETLVVACKVCMAKETFDFNDVLNLIDFDIKEWERQNVLKALQKKKLFTCNKLKQFEKLKVGLKFKEFTKAFDASNISKDNFVQKWYSFVCKVVKDLLKNESSDFDNILQRIGLCERFELERMFEAHKDEFIEQKFEETSIFSVKNK